MDMRALDFSGKHIWVTGAHQGIGRAVALAFVSLGAQVTGFDKQFTDEKKSEIGFRAVKLDIRSPEDVDKVAGAILQASPRLDVLVNAAGVLRMGTVESLSSTDWQETFDVNVTGVFHMLKHAVPILKAQRHGVVVNIGSNAAHVPRTSMAAYAASKGALAALSRCVALELAPFGIRCNLVSPGSTDTPMQRSLWRSDDEAAEVIAGDPEQFRLGIPLGKIASPEDIANLVVFLASDLAGHLTLQDIVIDGGATLGS